MYKQPAYASIYERLKQEIIEGDFSVGSFLPTEPVLEKRFNVSRTTVRRAIELLARDGFVETMQGRGTEVLNYKTNQNLNRVTSITQTLMNKGFDVKSVGVCIDIINPPQNISRDLQIDESVEVVRIQRIQLADDKPIAIMKNYIPAMLVPSIENHMDMLESLYNLLEDVYGIKIDYTYDRISAKVATFEEASMLGTKTGSPLIYMKRICKQGGRAVCVDRITLLGDRYELEIIGGN